MYQKFFGFSKKPFNITPNPDFLFLSKSHREVFAHLLYGIRNHSGFIEVTGEVGTGKTTVLRSLLGQLEDDAYRLAFIFNPSLSALELLQEINREFGIECTGDSKNLLKKDLNAFLLEENRQGRTVVLVIDEAQNLQPDVLEEIRLLSNLETETDKLIQIILVGQPELGQLLNQQNLRQIRQRITVRYHLQPMDFQDTRDYVRHRLQVAGYFDGDLFTTGALKKIFAVSGGFPRLINILCDRALLVAYTREEKRVGSRDIAMARRELARSPDAQPARLGTVTVLAGLVLVAAAGGFILRQGGPPTWFSSAETSSKAAMSVVEKPNSPVVETSPPRQVGMKMLVAVRRQLAGLSPADSLRTALDALFSRWLVGPLPADEPLKEGFLRRYAEERGLALTSLVGDVQSLLDMGLPFLLELNLPGQAEPRFLAVTGLRDGLATISPAAGEQNTLTLEELRGLWTGKGYLLWKNHEDLPFLGQVDQSGPGVVKLQKILSRAGFYQGPENGIYDLPTIQAVTRFQAQYGVAQDGRIGPQTLLLIYRIAGGYPQPSLASGEGQQGS